MLYDCTLIEKKKTLKNDFLEVSRVFSGEFLKNFLNSFSGEYVLESVARRYSMKKVFSPNSSLNEKKVLT